MQPKDWRDLTVTWNVIKWTKIRNQQVETIAFKKWIANKQWIRDDKQKQLGNGGVNK